MCFGSATASMTIKRIDDFIKEEKLEASNEQRKVLIDHVKCIPYTYIPDRPDLPICVNPNYVIIKLCDEFGLKYKDIKNPYKEGTSKAVMISHLFDQLLPLLKQQCSTVNPRI